MTAFETCPTARVKDRSECASHQAQMNAPSTDCAQIRKPLNLAPSFPCLLDG